MVVNWVKSIYHRSGSRNHNSSIKLKKWESGPAIFSQTFFDILGGPFFIEKPIHSKWIFFLKMPNPSRKIIVKQICNGRVKRKPSPWFCGQQPSKANIVKQRKPAHWKLSLLFPQRDNCGLGNKGHSRPENRTRNNQSDQVSRVTFFLYQFFHFTRK